MGPNGYALGINNNGLIAFHPRLKTVVRYIYLYTDIDVVILYADKCTYP